MVYPTASDAPVNDLKMLQKYDRITRSTRLSFRRNGYYHFFQTRFLMIKGSKDDLVLYIKSMVVIKRINCIYI